MPKNVLYGFSGKQAGVESEGGSTFFELEDVRETLEHFGLVLEETGKRGLFEVKKKEAKSKE